MGEVRWGREVEGRGGFVDRMDWTDHDETEGNRVELEIKRIEQRHMRICAD